MDILFSMFLIVFLLPVMLLIAFLIRFDSRGPILFKQQRVGKNGVLFPIYKFRTMVENAEHIGGYSTSKNDARITKFGGFLRKSSLDELPQLLNVLVGHMSFVGPRPDLLVQRVNYTEAEWNKRNTVRPGITGLAQATVRSETTSSERIKLDLQYIDKQSLVFDFKILLMTIKQIVSQGSY
jgi:lipopolysaccharide/colanic/teichoic acid biosynthesis glycosyltransferase